MRCAPAMKSAKRSLGPVDGPIGSYEVPSTGPAGPVWPAWLKYGPIDRITGVLAVGARFDGRRMSACSFTPSVDGIVACDHVAPGGPSEASAGAGRAAGVRRVASAALMHAANAHERQSLCLSDAEVSRHAQHVAPGLGERDRGGV